MQGPDEKIVAAVCDAMLAELAVQKIALSWGNTALGGTQGRLKAVARAAIGAYRAALNTHGVITLINEGRVS